MTTCTPVYGLPYPIGSDRPCDTASTFCDFASTVETQLDALDAIVDRTIDTVPMGIVTLTTVDTLPTLATTVQIPWDTVNVDTADMIDLVSNPYVITLPRYGRYWVSFWYQVNGQIAGSSVQSFLAPVNANISSTIIGPYSQLYSDGASFMYMSAAGEIRFASSQASPLLGNITGTPGTAGIALNFTGSGGGGTISAGTLSVSWIGDLS